MQISNAGEISSLFREFVIPHKAMNNAIVKMEEMRAERRLGRWDSEASGAFILAKSQSGKSHTVNVAYFYEHVVPQYRISKDVPEELRDDEVKLLQKKVICLKTPPKPNLGAFANALLKKLGSDFYPVNVWDRISHAIFLMRSLKIELLIVDSFDHLTKTNVDTRTLREATQVQDALKTMLEEGIPIVFVGLPGARDAIEKQFQLSHRVDEIPFDKINWETDREEFRQYVSWTNVYLVKFGVFQEYADFENDDVLEKLFFCSRRQYGILSNLLRETAKIAFNKGSHRMEREHLIEAVNIVTVKKKIRPYNPFGIKSFTLPVDLDDESWDIGIDLSGPKAN